MGHFLLLRQVQSKNRSVRQCSPSLIALLTLHCPVLQEQGWDQSFEPNGAQVHLQLISFGRKKSEKMKTAAGDSSQRCS